jgi:hypothetical protein
LASSDAAERGLPASGKAAIKPVVLSRRARRVHCMMR